MKPKLTSYQYWQYEVTKALSKFQYPIYLSRLALPSNGQNSEKANNFRLDVGAVSLPKQIVNTQ